MNNFKLNVINISRIIYLFAYVLIINLFIIKDIKITGLRIRIVFFCSKFSGPFKIFLEQSRVRQTLSFLLVNSINNWLIQGGDSGMYLLVALIQTPSKIRRTLFKGIDAGKKFKILIWDMILLQIAFTK